MMQICIYKTMIKIYCLNFIFFPILFFLSKTGWKKRLRFIEKQRLNLVMNSLHLRILTAFISYFYNFLTLALLQSNQVN